MVPMPRRRTQDTAYRSYTNSQRSVNEVLIPTIRCMPDRECVSLELDVEVVAMLRDLGEAGHVSEGEVIERAIRSADLRALVARIRSRSDLDEDAALRLVNRELKAARSEKSDPWVAPDPQPGDFDAELATIDSRDVEHHAGNPDAKLRVLLALDAGAPDAVC